MRGKSPFQASILLLNHLRAFHVIGHGFLFIGFFLVASLDCSSQNQSEWSEYLVKAEQFTALQSHDLATLYFQKALNAAEMHEGDSSLAYGLCSEKIGTFYLELQQFKLAEQHLLKSCFALKQSQSDSLLYHSLYSTAIFYQILGEHQKALFYYNERLKLTETLKTDKEIFSAMALKDLAFCLYEIGDYEPALSYLDSAIEILPLENETYALEYIEALSHKGVVLLEQSRLKEAQIILTKAKELYADNPGKQSVEYGTILNNLGNLYEMADRFDLAVSHLLEALQISRSIQGENHYEYGISLYNLALLYESMGQLDSARILHDQALKNIRASLGPQHPTYGRMLGAYASLLLSLGKTDLALPYYMLSNENLIQRIEDIFRYRSEDEAKAFLSTITAYFEMYQSINYRIAEGDTENAQEFLEMNLNNHLCLKGLLLNNVSSVFNELRNIGDTAIAKKLDHLEGLKKDYSYLLSASPSLRTYSLESLEREINTVEAELMTAYTKKFGRIHQIRKDWRDVKNHLKDDEIAIEFSRFEYSDAGYYVDSFLYVAYVISKKEEKPLMLFLFEESQLIELINAESVEQLLASRGTPVLDMKNPVLHSAEELYELIWQPLTSHLNGIKKIYYSVDGLLHQIPIGVIEYQNSPLFEIFEMIQLSSTSIITESNLAPNLDSALLIGGIEYGEKSKSLASVHSINWEFLPGTQREIVDLKLILEKAGRKPFIWKGLDATEGRFASLNESSFSVIHFATHGYYFEEEEGLDLFFNSDDPQLFKESLMRSGLIMAGANIAERDSEYDGILTALEISNLNLRNTKLVVLSACESGLGAIEGIEGVYGLQRAFKKAGVDMLLMSLWKVPDRETAEFMSFFYKTWVEGNLSVQSAFKQTQIQMRNAYPDEPYKWAAFVLIQ